MELKVGRLSWAQDTVGHLCSAKAAGVPFATAWADVTLEQPARPRDFGFDTNGTLEDMIELADAVDWFRGACEDAW